MMLMIHLGTEVATRRRSRVYRELVAWLITEKNTAGREVGGVRKWEEQF